MGTSRGALAINNRPTSQLASISTTQPNNEVFLTRPPPPTHDITVRKQHDPPIPTRT